MGFFIYDTKKDELYPYNITPETNMNIFKLENGDLNVPLKDIPIASKNLKDVDGSLYPKN